jgi:pyridoxamine 5'-phosphate oxidase-like protein
MDDLSGQLKGWVMTAATMPRQGDLALLDDPVAKELLNSQIPARLAYTWKDGSPRVVPVWAHWTGEEFVIGGPPKAPKMNILHDGDRVALTLDSNTFPYHSLNVRGTVTVRVVDGIPPEYTESCVTHLGNEGGMGWNAQVASLFREFGRISIKPDWVGIIDFERRFPSELAKAMSQAASAS